MLVRLVFSGCRRSGLFRLYSKPVQKVDVSPLPYAQLGTTFSLHEKSPQILTPNAKKPQGLLVFPPPQDDRAPTVVAPRLEPAKFTSQSMTAIRIEGLGRLCEA